MGELIDLGVAGNLVEKSGSWFAYDGQRIGQGRENSKQFMRDNPEVAAKLEAQIRSNAGYVADALLVGAENETEAAEANLEGADDAETAEVKTPSGKKKSG
jgi:recombination protein RecA